uniref:Uncharacterized protein n=1 Tax=Rhizobium rhizogenes (strain K84 / ATCC BAA-868) TaxID=311403 RepID=B2Z3U8_RHIR8|nr:hypothetical protein [Rhizobium rhizogenes K84]
MVNAVAEGWRVLRIIEPELLQQFEQRRSFACKTMTRRRLLLDHVVCAFSY